VQKLLSNKAKRVRVEIKGKIQGVLKEYEADYFSFTEEI
jgi:hypothetical protein